jgi:3-hydroxyacyl-CoA dehydrogenase
MLSSMETPAVQLPAVAILGAGTQGRRLAFMWTSRGNDVHLIDAQAGQLEASVRAVDDFRLSWSTDEQQKGKVYTHLTTELSAALQNAWLVVECVPERLPLKRQVIAQLDSLAPEDTIIASNSSSYSCCEIVEGLELRNKARVLSAHTYWPPETPAIEIMGHDTTDQFYVDVMMKQTAAHGFDPFHVRKPSMGYLYNR